MIRRICYAASVAVVGLALTAGEAYSSIKLPVSRIDQEWRLAQRQSAMPNYSQEALFASSDTSFKTGEATNAGAARPKSPAKAFALSMLVPGIGQYYNGSKVKAAAFLGIEATAWILQFKWRADGNRRTEEFEAFHEAHWSEDSYGEYLYLAYRDDLGNRYRDDDSISAPELSHHLPDTRTQQFYEMTGKYDQFAWGWDDATLDGHDLQHYSGMDTIPRAVGGDIPVSIRRNTYETMRYNANKKFSNARKMIMLALGNRLISAFEAFVTAKRSQSRQPAAGAGKGNPEFSHWKVQGKLKSIYARYDTPCVKVTYGF
jgi:hypothetical protein